MSFIARLQRAREIVAQQGRLSTRALERELEIGGDELDALIEELVDVQQVARREGKILVWAGDPGAGSSDVMPARETRPSTASPPAGTGEARKVVTIVFADLIGSTALHERLDAESAQRVMERYYATLRAAVDAHGGAVVKLLGDGVMAAFGLKQVAEDDALRAVRAAAAMQGAFRALVGVEAALGAAGLRVAVNTGEVVVSGARDDVIGDPVNVAARLQEQGGDGDVVLGEATRRLVATRVTLAPLGSVTLKGRAEAVAAYRLVSLEPPAGATAAPFVGRESELARLETMYDAAVATPATRLGVLLGSPGLGKSRLIDELGRRHADDATILAAHCDAAGGSTFAPLAQVLRGFLGLDEGAAGEAVRAAVAGALATGDEGERARIAGGIAGLLGGTATSPEETFFVVRRFLAGLAAARPVVLVIDDLHWAEPLLLDLVEHLVQWGAGVPLFVLVGARPELRDLRSSLVVPSALVGDVVTLGGLDAGAAMRLAANVIGAADLPAAVAAKVLATSEGNPLFVGELVRMLVQEGALTKDGDRWIVGANLAALEMPPTIHALLAARIERLGAEDRTVLERASVVGRHFSRSAVAALLGRNGSELDGRLESLRRSELIERDTGWLLGEPVLRFHHVLIRDAAYRRLLKGTRAELHARLADWIEGQVGETPEHDEMIGWHLEQAHQLLGELGPLDAAGATLGERAARRLAAAGRRALARDDVSLAAGLLGRALQRLAADAAERADLVLDWCEALLAAGDVGPAADAIAELARVAGAAPDNVAARLRAWHTCFAGQLTVLTAPEALHATADQVGAAARDLAALNDAAGEAKAHFVHAQALARLGKIGACEAALDQALAAARRAGDRRRANAVLAGAPLAALWGPSPVTRASGRCLDVVRVLRITQGAPAVEAVALSCQGVLEALRGRTEAARRMLASSRTMVEELGISHRLFETDVFAGRIDLLEGNAPAAERALRAGYDGLRDLGLGIDAARAAALLGRALLAQDRAAEAETLSHESELLAGDDLQAAIAWRGVRAEALARRGEHTPAIVLANEAVEIAVATDALLDHADARLALAAALRAAGRGAEVDAEERRAIELWEAKGATLLADGARRRGTSEPENDRPPLPRRDHREVAPPEGPPPGPHLAKEGKSSRRVQPNAATAMLARLHAHLAARDFDAVAELSREDMESIDHPSGSSYGREAIVASLRRFFRSRDPHFETEPLATLGDFLVLARRRTSASGGGGGRYDVGAYENEALELFEVDESGKVSRTEVFAADKLGAAVARLYERFAELLPEGPQRERAAATARSVAGWIGPIDPDCLATTVTPSMEMVDHRNLGTWSTRGAAEFLDHTRLQTTQLARGFTGRTDGVLALAPDALLVRCTYFGIARDSGGAFENVLLQLFAFGADGLIARSELWEPDREADPLARFDALTADAPRPKTPVHRRIRPNAATRISAKYERIVADRDFAGLETLVADDAECIDHPTGATYGAAGMRTGNGWLMQSPDARLRCIPLATLGDSWGLVRREMAASSALGGRFDIGAFEIVDLGIWGTDERGRVQHAEIFAAERLGAAIVRLYERYAESLPDGAASRRARAVARSLAVFDGPTDFDRIANANAPSVQVVDQRILGTWFARGREAWLTQWREHLALSAESGARYGAVLALEPTAILVHQTFFGVGRESGGDFENVTLVLHVFDGDGLIARTEVFEPDRETEALARFDALTAGVAPRRAVRRRVRPNAATASSAALEAAFARRDLAAVDALLGDPLTTIEHPTGTTYGREGQLESSRRMMRMPDLEFRFEPLATLGERLVLGRRTVTASGTSGGRFDVGEFEIESIVLNEVDAAGRLMSSEVFAPDRLCQAITRLHARYAESLPDGPERTRAEGIARARSVWDGTIDADRVMSAFAPSFVCVDHRSLGTWSAEGLDLWSQHWRVQAELAAGFSRRDDDILALAPGAYVARRSWFGINRATGGPFENVLIGVDTFGADGLYTRCECFEPGQEAEALARFDEIVGESVSAAPRDFTNAATRSLDRFVRATADRDWGALTDAFAPSLRFDDRRPLLRLQLPQEGFLEQHRVLFDAPNARWSTTAIATRGERLVLARLLFQGDVAGGGGALEIDHLSVLELGDDGRFDAIVLFEPADLDAAYAELDARFAAGEAAGFARAWEAPRAVAAAWNARDFDAFLAIATPDYVGEDHRRLQWGSMLSDPAVWIRSLRLMVEMAPDFRCRIDHVVLLADRGALVEAVEMGTRDGGAFETRYLWVTEVDEAGRMPRFDLYDLDQIDEARARFAALAAPAPSAEPFANAASATNAPVIAAIIAHDWPRLTQLFADDFRMYDRRRVVQLELDREQNVAFTRVLADGRTIRASSELLATRGERLALGRAVFEFSDADVGPSEIAFLVLTEVSARGRIVVYVRWDVEDLDAAYAELDARWRAGEGAEYGTAATFLEGTWPALARRDWDAAAASYAPTLVADNHRLAGWGTLRGPDAFLEAFRAMFALAPDARYRTDHLRAVQRGIMADCVWVGTREGGAFESPFLVVAELDRSGLCERLDFYDPHHLETARARFDEIKVIAPLPATAPDAPLASMVKRNAAAVAMDHWQAAYDAGFDTGNWEPVRAVCAPGFVFDDRRRLALISGDVEMLIASARERVASGARVERTQLGTAGDRVVIERWLLSGGPSDGRFEIEYLGVFEVDEAGLITAFVMFDPDGARVAQREAWARWAAIEPDVAENLTLLGHFVDAFNAHDLGAFLATMSDDVVVVDHRRTGMGRLEGAGTYGASIEALWSLAPGTTGELGSHWPAYDRHGVLTVIRRHGGLVDGGEYESEYLQLFVRARERFMHFEMFELEDLGTALARFEELCAPTAAGPSRRESPQ